MVARREAAEKAHAALEAWLRGMNEGGHEATPEDIRETYRIALEHYLKEGA